MRVKIRFALIGFLALFPFSDALPDPSLDRRLDELIKRLTLEEKTMLLAGRGMDTLPVARLKIPALKMTDGPVGVRIGQNTCFPAGIALAASWDMGLLSEVGRALGRETIARGGRLLLGPCLNIQRLPLGGRNFESFGEDPYLSARLAVHYVRGVQSEKVIATPKHFACNNQERDRLSIDVIADERTLREIYLPAFEAAVREGGAWSVMAAYNKVNGFYSTENEFLLNGILKREWGFSGFVVSDWGATHSTVAAARAGLDVEMPDRAFFAESLAAAVREGRVKEETVDDKVRRVLRALNWVGLLDEKTTAPEDPLDPAVHRSLALRAAREGIVLLKNEGDLLPLDPKRVRTLAVVGPNAAQTRTGGGGSSEVTPFYSISPWDALYARLAGKIGLRYAPGCLLDSEIGAVPSSALFTIADGRKVNGLWGEYFNNRDLSGRPAQGRLDPNIDFDWREGAPVPGLNQDDFSVRWTGKLKPPGFGEFELVTSHDDGLRLWLDGKLLVDDWREHATEIKKTRVSFETGREYDLKVEYYERGGRANARLRWNRPRALLLEAVQAAAAADAVVVFAGLSRDYESEGFDRPDMELPEDQNVLIESLAAVNRNVIVVLQTGAPVAMGRWLGKARAVLEAWYPGQEGGTAVADVLSGDYYPSGKLPVTFPRAWADCPAYGNYPGRDGTVTYAEGIFIGYRYFETKNVPTLFPFGHGLSYTRWEYNALGVQAVGDEGDGWAAFVSVDIKNAGSREGTETAQLYLKDLKASVERPALELKGFARVTLTPGQKRTIRFRLDRRSLSYWDIGQKGWKAEPGEFEVLVGSSCRDIRCRTTFTYRGP